jgi:uncharacterized protein YkwD
MRKSSKKSNSLKSLLRYTFSLLGFLAGIVLLILLWRFYSDKEAASIYNNQQYEAVRPTPNANVNITDRLATVFASYHSTKPLTPTPSPVSGVTFSICTLSGSSSDAEELLFLDLLNQYRRQNGKTALTLNTKLTDAAKWLSNDMATKNYFDHTDSQGRSPFDRMRAWSYNYSAAAENVLAGNATALSGLEAWKNSPAHNANMLGNYTEIGIGRACVTTSTYKWYWTTKFGTPL